MGEGTKLLWPGNAGDRPERSRRLAGEVYGWGLGVDPAAWLLARDSNCGQVLGHGSDGDEGRIRMVADSRRLEFARP